MAGLPYIPEEITVHLGRPDEEAENITLPFQDYIKNVASSEIYPTWPEESIEANIYAQITYALNRVYTEWYRSQGYDFDITNTTQFDQAFVKDRDIFENISIKVDEIFNDYVRKQGTISPYFTQYCNGTTSKCDGLSQWGTVGLAEDGLNSLEILRFYYGNDIEIVENAPIRPFIESYRGEELKEGSEGDAVREIQIDLNTISKNWPAIPRIPNEDGKFGEETTLAVKKLQQIFNLEDDGIVGKATWYKIKYVYTSVRKLSELVGDSIKYEDLKKQYPNPLTIGATGSLIEMLQYYLSYIAQFNSSIESTEIDGIFGVDTENAVKSFQRFAGLPETGIVDEPTWNGIYSLYRGAFLETGKLTIDPTQPKQYPGYVLKEE